MWNQKISIDEVSLLVNEKTIIKSTKYYSFWNLIWNTSLVI